MDVIDGMRTFVTAVDTGSFTAAADRLGVSKKLVSKYVAQLEDRLRVRLLHRTTRRLSLTDAGARYYDRCQQLIEDFDGMESALRDDRQGLGGTLHVSAPVVFGESFLLPLIAEFCQAHPDLSIKLQFSDTYVDLADEGMDLAIRIGTLEPSSMKARRLAPTENWLVAAPAFVDKYGKPRHPRELSKFECIYDTNFRSKRNWPFQIDGAVRTVPISGKMSVSSLTAAVQLAVLGQGIALCPDYAVAKEVTDGRLVRLLPDLPQLDAGIYLVYLESRYMPARVRTFIDFAVTRLGNATQWEQMKCS
ncbi:MAG: LysR family transcriptional regulator [Rhizobiaceae bacterium]